MSNNQKDKVAEPLKQTDSTGNFIQENSKSLIIIGSAIVALIVLFIGYQKLYLAPREEQAIDQMYKAQNYFEQKDWDKAIKGDGNFPGFEQIIEDYDNTKSANLAYYYLGVAYLNKGEFQKAVDNLTNYSGNDKIIAPNAFGLTGDAYVELKNYDKAITYYKKAIDKGSNQFISAVYLKKLGLVYEEKKDFKAAADTYTKIKKDYPQSTEAGTIDMYIARSQAKL